MPLMPGKKHVGTNIKTEERAGKPHKQALAIALAVARKHKRRMKAGGEVGNVEEEQAMIHDKTESSGHHMFLDDMEDDVPSGYAEGGEVTEPAEHDDEMMHFAKSVLKHQSRGHEDAEPTSFPHESMDHVDHEFAESLNEPDEQDYDHDDAFADGGEVTEPSDEDEALKEHRRKHMMHHILKRALSGIETKKHR